LTADVAAYCFSARMTAGEVPQRSDSYFLAAGDHCDQARSAPVRPAARPSTVTQQPPLAGQVLINLWRSSRQSPTPFGYALTIGAVPSAHRRRPSDQDPDRATTLMMNSRSPGTLQRPPLKLSGIRTFVRGRLDGRGRYRKRSRRAQTSGDCNAGVKSKQPSERNRSRVGA